MVAVLSAAVGVVSDAATVEVFVTVPLACQTAEGGATDGILPPGSCTRLPFKLL